MKALSIILLIIYQSVLLISQVAISGEVTDAKHSALPYANILLYSTPDSLFESGTITDETGRYDIQINDNFTGYLELRSMGFESMIVPILEQQYIYNVQLNSSAHEIDEVVIVAQKPMFEKQADRLTINVESNISTLGGSSLELLEKSPGVTVDRANGLISLNGKSGVLVMIDNKIRRLPEEALINLLNSIPVNEVEKIELINNPSSKYEASGSGGIIHLITKHKNTDGWISHIGGSTSFYDKSGGGLNGSLTWNKDKFNGFTSYSISIDRTEETWTQKTRKSFKDYIFFSDSRIFRHTKTWLHNLTLGFNYQLSPITTLETLVTGFRRDYNQKGFNTGQYKAKPELSQSFESDIYEDNIRNMGTIYSGLIHHFNPNHKLSGSVELIGNKQNQPSSYVNEYENGDTELLDAAKSTPLNIWIGQLDYDWKLSSNFDLSMGARFSDSGFDNKVEIFTRKGNIVERNEDLSLLSELNEKIFSTYLSTNWQVKDKWNIRAGLRMEQAVTDLIENRITPVVDRKENHLFPNLVSEFIFNERSRVSISYGRRITRPTFSDLAPFVFYPNPVTLFYGNPSLLPSVSQQIDLNYSFDEVWMTLGFADVQNKIAPIHPHFDADQSIFVYNSENFHKSQDYRLQLGFPFRPAKWLSYNNTVTLRNSRIKVIKNDEALTISGLDYQGTIQFQLPQDFSLGLNGFFFLNSAFGISIIEPYGKLDIGLRKKFKTNNSTLGITFSDVLDSYFWKLGLHPDYPTELTANLDFTFGQRGVRISYSMSLGNNQIKKKDIDTGSEVEKGRLN